MYIVPNRYIVDEIEMSEDPLDMNNFRLKTRFDGVYALSASDAVRQCANCDIIHVPHAEACRMKLYYRVYRAGVPSIHFYITKAGSVPAINAKGEI